MPRLKLRAMLIVGWGAVALSSPCLAQTASELPYQRSEPEKLAQPRLRAGANSFALGQAQALLESKGFLQVSSLVNGSDGIWRGTASKDGKTVDVNIDFQGHVDAR